MEWAQFVIFFIGVFGLFIWNRSESRNDIRYMDAKLESNRELVRALHEALLQESKDFHGRLCALKEKYLQKLSQNKNYLAMNNYPDLPSFKELPHRIVIDGLIGYLYGSLFQVNPFLTMTICAIRVLAHTLFYQLANFFLGDEKLQCQKHFVLTFTAVNVIFIVALKELSLIGHIFSALLTLGILGHLISRISYIQDHEQVD